MPYRITLESDSPISVVNGTIIPTPPVDPPPPPPPIDTRPFDWPPEWNAPVDYAARYVWSWPAGEENAYAYQQGTGNPVGWQHHNAGIIQAGRFLGLRLWATHLAQPQLLRDILAGRQ